VAIEVAGTPANGVGVVGERIDAGHDGGGNAGAAEDQPARLMVGVIDRDTRVRIRDRRDVRLGTVAADRCHIAVARLEARLILEGAAAAARAAPGRLGPPAAGAGFLQRGTADSNDVGRRGGVLCAEATVAAREGEDLAALVVVGVEARLAAELPATPTVGDPIRLRGRVIVGGAEVGKGVGRGLHQQDMAVRADRARHVEVERNLLSPAAIATRVVCPTGLVRLAETSVGTGATWQAKLRAVDGKIRLRIGIVECIHDRDGLAVAAGRRELVRGLQIDRVEPAGATPWPGVVAKDRMAAGETERGWATRVLKGDRVTGDWSRSRPNDTGEEGHTDDEGSGEDSGDTDEDATRLVHGILSLLLALRRPARLLARTQALSFRGHMRPAERPGRVNAVAKPRDGRNRAHVPLDLLSGTFPMHARLARNPGEGT